MGHLPGALSEPTPAGSTDWWGQVPGASSVEPPWTSAIAFAAVCLGPLVGLARSGLSGGWVLTTTAAIVLGGLAVRVGRRAIGPFLVGTTAIAAVLAGTATPRTSAWSVVAVVLLVVTAWWLAGAGASGDEADRARRLRPAVAASTVAAGASASLGLTELSLVLAVLGLVLAGLIVLPVSARLLGLLDRPVEVVSRAVGAVTALPALALVTLRWCTDRVVGHDPLRANGHQGWTPPPESISPTRLHAAAPARGRWRSRLSALLAIAVVAVPVALWLLRPETTPTPPAVVGEPSWPTLYAETSDITRRLRLDPTTVFRLPDYRGEFVNQEDGRRRTWNPPPCECPRYRVWWYGASAAWGLYQRDQESIASEVAKAAWRQGVALEIENRATPGFVVDQEVRAIEADLETEEPPDLVVVMDGANDATLQVDRNEAGRGDDRSGGPDIDESLGVLSRLSDLWADLRRSDGAGSVTPETDDSTPRRAPEQLAEHVAARFRSNITSARAVTAAHGTEVVFLWQPTVATTAGGTGDPTVTGGGKWAEVMRRTPGQLDGLVLDLSDSLVGSDRPVFVDEVHFSEHGADLLGQVIARDLLARLRPPGTP